MPEFNMLIGLPGSGKSYYSELLKKDGYVVHSSDAIRKELYGDENVQHNPKEVFSILHKRVYADLKAGKDVVYDATNVTSKLRMQTLKYFSNLDITKTCTIVARSFEDCVEMDRKRSRTVGEEVLKKIISKWTTPSYGEGWDNIYIYYPNELDIGKYGSCRDAYKGLMDYNQNNPHHKNTLGEHIKSVTTYVSNHSPISQDVIDAAYLHDIGKPMSMTVDDKGIAHYFQHANIGAYNTFFYDGVDHPINVSLLVNYHMIPFNFTPENAEKMEKKYTNLLGSELYHGLIQLHNADTLCSSLVIENDLVLV